MLRYDSAARVEAQSNPIGAGSKKRVEKSSAHVWRDARAGIDDADTNATVLSISRKREQSTARRSHCLYRIECKVHQYLVELERVASDSGQPS